MTKVWKAAKKRSQLIYRQKGLCYWCKEPMKTGTGPDHPRAATLDHLKPKSLGGSGSIDNLVAACRQCNNSRGNAHPDMFHVKQSGSTR